MTMPWSASAPPKKYLNSTQSPTSNNPSSGNLGIAIPHEPQLPRSAIESRFHAYYDLPQPPQQEKLHRQAPLRSGRRGSPRLPTTPQSPRPTTPRTADPRLCQFPTTPQTPKDKVAYSMSARRVVNLDPPAPPQYDMKSPVSGRHHEPRAPQSASHSHWPNEKTPTSPYHPRQPHGRRPPSGEYRYPTVPHTAHPLGGFHRPDPRDNAHHHRSSPRHDGSMTAAPEPKSSGSRFGINFDFGKVKFSIPSPRSANRTDNSPSSPRLKTPTFRPRDARRQGYYEYKTPYNPEFDFRHQRDGPKSAGVIFDDGYSRSPYESERPHTSREVVAPVPRDEKVDLEDGKEKKDRSCNLVRNWLAQLTRRLPYPFKRPTSRIPSVQPDAEPQTLEELEKGLHDNTVFAWTTVAGAWLIQFSTFGYIWSWNVFQDYYMDTFPEDHSVGRLTWIGSLQLTLPFAFGIISGKCFDAGWFRYITIIGSLIFGLGVFILSFVDPSKFFQLFVVQGLLLGCGLGLVFLPSVAICMLHFKERKALVTGIAMSGSSFGAMIYPIMLKKLLEPHGFEGAVRSSSYLVVVLLVIANCLVSKPPKHWSPRYPPTDLLGYFKERQYALVCGGIFLTTLALWFPQSYIENHAAEHGVSAGVSFYSVAIIGVAGAMGRIAMGIAAEKLGPWNLLIPVTASVFVMICTVASLKNVASVVIVSLIYGFVSGAWLSLLFTALASLSSRPGELGHRIGMALSVSSMGVFLSGPAHAGLVSRNWVWSRAIGLLAVITIIAVGIFWYTRKLVAEKRRFQYV